MNRIAIRTTSAVLSAVITLALLKGVGVVADVESAAMPSTVQMAHAEPAAASAPRVALRVATLQP